LFFIFYGGTENKKRNVEWKKGKKNKKRI